MKILIIGNGFDLEHNLPTKYWDFMEFIKCYKNLEKHPKHELEKWPMFSNLNENVREYLFSDEVFTFSNHKDALKELDRLISQNVWIDYFSKKSGIENKGWIDFESEIADIIKCLEYYMNYNITMQENPSSQRRPDNEVLYQNAHSFLDNMKNTGVNHYEKFDTKKFHGDTAKVIIKELICDLNNLIRCLEIYLEDVVGKSEVEYKAKDIAEIENIDKVLSFNYTNTYQKIYGEVNDGIEYDYIHGKANIQRTSKENNMVLGIDEYLEDDERNNKLEFIRFKKYFQRIYKKTGCKYKNWVSEIEQNDNEKNEVFIFGHSLDVTDKDVLKELIMAPNTTTTIFYYNNDVYAQQIENLVKVIKQDKLIASVYGANPRIIFKQQQPKIGVEKLQ
ncbi:bacteriophage abortive infection AbiH family protein [Clostridium cellulovorans]|uniref:Bacteriophage abortive infection AbiH n=1 Tax=Clostridium cellulovorans (strain ATCC 35296 / DSM 3052 / OCM 3 / 743B) TaxID=573061 RepID=D9SKU9_CLOC7|nr:bacteriophage abortive infection AbiH family protein [Clostridium cellulovorans]ADL53521.1 hypothetical protein Clocel_3853 [Clostridium cellulovorans 743B]